jgi:hypothetical protein
MWLASTKTSLLNVQSEENLNSNTLHIINEQPADDCNFLLCRMAVFTHKHKLCVIQNTVSYTYKTAYENINECY